MCDLPEAVQQELNSLEEHYEDFEVNNKGANGYLFLAKNKVSKQEVAIKFYAGEPGLHQHDEPRQLAALDSKNVLPILDARTVSDEWGYFITPKCNEGDIDDFIAKKPPVHIAIDTALGICNGISCIHAEKMLHRDLKPGNIVINNEQPRIADFGSVKIIENGNEFINASRHSILYRPPESFSTDQYSVKGDVYQIGLLIFQLLGGYLSYNGEEYLSKKDIKTYEQITDQIDRSIFIDRVIQDRAEKGQLVQLTTLPPWITTSTKRQLKAIIHPDPAKRLSTIADIAAVLTQIRATVHNWEWHESCPTLFNSDHTIQFREVSKNNFVAYKKINNGNYRKISRCPVTNFATLMKKT